MAEALSDATLPATVDPRSLRTARILRAGALLVTGLVITFTAPLHQQVEFDRWLLLVGFVLIGFATIVEYIALRSTPASRLLAVRGGLAIAAAFASVLADGSTGLAWVIAVWAALTALTTLTRTGLGGQPRSVGLPSALLDAGLVAAALLTRADPVAMIGFFGAYAVIRSVFLGISAFDGRSSSGERQPLPSAAADTI